MTCRVLSIIWIMDKVYPSIYLVWYIAVDVCKLLEVNVQWQRQQIDTEEH